MLWGCPGRGLVGLAGCAGTSGRDSKFRGPTPSIRPCVSHAKSPARGRRISGIRIGVVGQRVVDCVISNSWFDFRILILWGFSLECERRMPCQPAMPRPSPNLPPASAPAPATFPMLCRAPKLFHGTQGGPQLSHWETLCHQRGPQDLLTL